MQGVKTIANHRSTVCEVLFCMALLAVFLPVKIYPVVFLAASLFFAWDTRVWLRRPWVVFLAIFTGYVALVFVVHLPADHVETINFIKLPVNFTFLYVAVGWMAQRNNDRLLRWVDLALHVAMGLTLLQLLVYHQVAEFRWIAGVSTSAQGSALYQPEHYFWGLGDKNMFGARIALLGFVYVLLPVVERHTLVSWRIALVLLLAWLSLSRTPMVALLLAVFCLLWAASRVRWRIALGALAALVLPVLAQKVVRIGSITASNDGMGVRLTYWKTFFEHFSDISPLGNGFMSGGSFLSRYAPFYHSEPHIHNTFLSAYLDFGAIGFLSYTLFLVYFYRFCTETLSSRIFWQLAFIPLLAIMMILYSGYDNDIVLYLVLVFLLGNGRPVFIKQVEGRIG